MFKADLSYYEIWNLQKCETWISYYEIGELQNLGEEISCYEILKIACLISSKMSTLYSKIGP